MANGMGKKLNIDQKVFFIFLFTRNEAYGLVWFLHRKKVSFSSSTFRFYSHKNTVWTKNK